MTQKSPNPLTHHRVILVVICVNMANFAYGTCFGWTDPMVPKLRNHTSDSPLATGLTVDQEGWIGSCICIGALMSSLGSGQLGAKIGKKLTLTLCVALIQVSYIFLLFATEVWVLYVARFIQGLSGGLLTATLPMYIGEISTDGIRGALGSSISIFTAGGILYVYSIGPYVTYMTLQWCCLAIPMILLITFIFIPETPYYLAKKGRKSDLLKSLEFLRGSKGKIIEDEMKDIQAAADADTSRNESALDIFRDRASCKALVICFGLFIFQQLNGFTAITFNSQTIFSSAKSTIDPSVASIIMALTGMISNFFPPFIIERTGRKLILLISALGTSFSLFALGTFFYIQAFGDVSHLMWIPIPALIIFNISYSLGSGPVPWAMLGELFPSNVKPMASSFAAVTNSFSNILITRWYPELNVLGAYYTFFLFGSSTVVSLFFIIFYVIETKGLSMTEIQEKLRS